MDMIITSLLFISPENPFRARREGCSTSSPTLYDVGIQDNLLIAKTGSHRTHVSRAALVWAQQHLGPCTGWTPIPRTPVQQSGRRSAPAARVTLQGAVPCCKGYGTDSWGGFCSISWMKEGQDRPPTLSADLMGESPCSAAQQTPNLPFPSASMVSWSSELCKRFCSISLHGYHVSSWVNCRDN